MARPTIARLQEELIALRHNAALVEAERDSLKLEVAALKRATPVRATNVRPAYVPKPPAPDVLARREAMAKAKELAMRSGTSVRVDL